jgi:trehalose-6-phosphate synthase
MAVRHSRGAAAAAIAMQALFPGARLIVAANRAPYRRSLGPDGQPRWERPAGGLTAALDPLMQRFGGVWIAAQPGERQDLHVPPEAPRYQVDVLGVPEETYRAYYSGYANAGLWPLCHNLVERAHFRPSDWLAYRHVNRMFAERIVQVAKPEDIVFLHDYPLVLVPGYLRGLGYTGPIAHFWHIPWPPTVVLRLLPERRLLLQGLLDADWIGFQTEDSVDAFSSAARKELGARVIRDADGLRLLYQGRVTRLQAVPISIDTQHVEEIARSAVTQERIEKLRSRLNLQDGTLLLGVDRLDYTKGIPARLDGFARLLARYPSLHGRVRFLQVGVPTRTEIQDYRRLAVSVRRRVSEINRRYGRPGWRPVRLVERNLSLDQLVALYRLADVAVVSSLYDGLNLVAKEYVAARVDGEGALCLSETAGAYQELRDAFPLSPLSPERVAEGLARALFASQDERVQRMAKLRAAVSDHTIHTWLERVMRGLREAVPQLSGENVTPV